MGSGAWDLQVYEAMLSILYVRENTWTEDLKHGKGLREQTSLHVSELSNQNTTYSELAAFCENVDSFSKVCAFLLYTEHTVR